MHFEKYDRLRYEYTYVPIWAISTLFESNMKIAISTYVYVCVCVCRERERTRSYFESSAGAHQLAPSLPVSYFPTYGTLGTVSWGLSHQQRTESGVMRRLNVALLRLQRRLRVLCWNVRSCIL